MQDPSKGGARTINERTVLKDKYKGKYQTSDAESLSGLYWKQGLMDYQNKKMIDNYLLINECEYYKKYFNDDFKWLKIREAARKMISDQAPYFSDKFQIVIPISLGRYDSERKGFKVSEISKFKDFRRVVLNGRDEEICGKRWIIEHYPRDAAVILNKPFNFDFFELDEHIAQAFILRFNKGLTKKHEDVDDKKYKRVVFMRVRMTFLKYLRTIRRDHRTPAAVFFGQIDGFEIFENSDETGLLYTVDFDNPEPDTETIIKATKEAESEKIDLEAAKKQEDEVTPNASE